MKIFQKIQKQYAVLGVSSSNPWARKHSFNKRVLMGILMFGCIIASHFEYIFRVANGFLEYMACIASLSGNIITFVSFAAIVVRRNLLFENIDNMEKLIRTRLKYPKSKAFFLKTSQQVERLSKLVFTSVVKIFLQCLILPKCISSYCYYFNTDSGSNSFELPVPMWFPFDSNNPIGYAIAIILEYIAYWYSFSVIACGLALGIGAYWLAISATKEIQRVLHVINDHAQVNERQSNELNTFLFAEFIDTHGIVKQIANDFSDIFQPIIMSVFIWSLLSISAAMLTIQLQIMYYENVMTALLPLINGFIGLSIAFIACELGQRMSDAFDEINFTIAQFNWYLYPVEIQRKLSLIIAITQQPVSLECFGSITCTREVFKNVIHRAYSYFTVLRQLGN